MLRHQTEILNACSIRLNSIIKKPVSNLQFWYNILLCRYKFIESNRLSEPVWLPVKYKSNDIYYGSPAERQDEHSPQAGAVSEARQVLAGCQVLEQNEQVLRGRWHGKFSGLHVEVFTVGGPEDRRRGQMSGH